MNPLMYNGKRAKVIILLFFVLIAGHVANIFGCFLQVDLLKELQTSEVSDSRVNANDLRQQMIAILNVIVTILTIIFFIGWFRRAYHNLQRAGSPTMHTEGWAAGCWFIPLLNLVRPYQIMREIWEDTQELNASKLERKNTTIVGLWWTFYLISNIFATIVNRTTDLNTNIDGFIYQTYMDLASSVLEIISAGLTLYMIKQTAQFEEALFEYMDQPAEESEHLLGNIAVGY
ncbi:MAG TPA: DUF4328 domain-containing protein [Phnomibacter sp.]|nr:DUF4328 domain-containing protein [Phnomibacter sp.]